MSQNQQWLDVSLQGMPPAAADRVRAFRLLVLEGARLRSLLEGVLAPTGVTVQQGAMLSWIEAQPEAPTITAVAAGLAMSHQNVKQIAAALQRKGLLAIEVDARDRRARRLVLSEHHHRFWAERNAGDFEAVQAWMAAWDEAQVGEAIRLLRQLHRHLDAVAAAPRATPE